VRPQNDAAYALGEYLANGRFHVRRVVWGRLMARSERRDGEVIKRVWLFVEPRGSGEGV